MTTPGQPAPDGAYVVGGDTVGNTPIAGSYKYGQGMTEDLATQLFNPIAALGSAMGSVSGALEYFEKILLTLPLEALQLFRPLIGALEPFISVAQAAASIANSLIVRPIMATVEYVVQAIIDLVNRFLAPFGRDGIFTSLEDALNVLVHTMTSPWTLLGSIEEWVSGLFEHHAGRISALEDKVSALNLALDPATTETGGYDDCKNATKFESMSGYADLTPTGWGALTSSVLVPALYVDSPTTDRHGAGIKVKSRRVGITYLVICSNDDMTNTVALKLENPTSGSDTATIVTGSGPEDFTPQTPVLPISVNSDSFWSIRYEPYDEDSPTSNTFHVFKNGQSVLRWQDNGNIVIHGADHRRVGVLLNGLDHATRRGYDITDFTYYDWIPAAPQ